MTTTVRYRYPGDHRDIERVWTCDHGPDLRVATPEDYGVLVGQALAQIARTAGPDTWLAVEVKP